ncbi:MAG TPA: hypothetical protein DEO86_08385 [Colwellia sp.]|nr:hypothetical protein [Colwellia sp.]|tara:strand:- start:865 stop:1077 length:213 start_codon:yes stop_codon:yes gene_type:complete
MNQSCGTSVPHTYALRLIARYKLSISNKASVLKKGTNLKHTEALDEVCKKEGYKDYYTWNQVIKTLLDQG